MTTLIVTGAICNPAESADSLEKGLVFTLTITCPCPIIMVAGTHSFLPR
jgi:hypothetical protein